MANPKTIYKSNGTEITFVDTSKEVKKAIEKLSKEALGASAKVIRKKLRGDLPVYTKRFKNHIASWKFIDRKTGQPTLHIGFYSWQRVKKKGKLPYHIKAQYINPQDGKTYTYVSEDYYEDLLMLTSSKVITKVPVYINPKNTSDYYMDLVYILPEDNE